MPPPPTLWSGPQASGSSSSDDRLMRFIDGVEYSLRSLFHGEENEFVVTNDFVEKLVELTAKILRTAVEREEEGRVFYHWKENLESYRKIMLSGPAGTNFASMIRLLKGSSKVVTGDRLEAINNFCPKPPDFPTGP